MDNLNNYHPVASIPFMGKLTERVVANQLQAFLEDTDSLDPFQSKFRLHHETKTALVVLLNDLLWQTV